MITVRKRSCGKVMFSQACVKNSVHRGKVWQTPPFGRHLPWQTPLPGRHTPWQTPIPGRHPLGRHPPGYTPPWADPLALGKPPPHPDGHCSERYASYWNAFLSSIHIFEFSFILTETTDGETGPEGSLGTEDPKQTRGVSTFGSG